MVRDTIMYRWIHLNDLGISVTCHVMFCAFYLTCYSPVCLFASIHVLFCHSIAIIHAVEMIGATKVQGNAVGGRNARFNGVNWQCRTVDFSRHLC